jgi:Protein of unknown function (DUF3592)
MFASFVHALQSYNQVGLLLGALMFVGIGGLMLGNSLYWRLHAPRVSGTIIGVIARGDMYTPVYRYTSPDGVTRLVRSTVSSGAVRGKETARVVPLMISPHNPSQAQAADGWGVDALGALLFAAGAGLAWIAIVAYPVTWMTGLMALAMLAYLAERLRRTLIPKELRPSYAEWRQRQAAEAAIDPDEVTPIETLLATPEWQAKSQAQSRKNRKAAPLVAIFAAMLLALGVYQARELARLQSIGLRVQGQVVDLRQGSGDGVGATYHAVVQFRTADDVTIEFTDSVGTNPPGYRPGDTVTVLYRADDPQRDAMIDRGAFWNWLLPGVLLLGAALLGWLSTVMIAARRAGDGGAPTPAAAAR